MTGKTELVPRVGPTMRYALRKRVTAGHSRANGSQTMSAKEIRDALWQIGRRLPAYVRLGWALGREPAIPSKDRALLVSAALYSLTPAQLVTGWIPVVGQIDGILVFLLGVRHALRNCPPEVAAAHLRRLRLESGQIDRDLRMVVKIGASVVRSTGSAISRDARFAARVVSGFSRRAMQRLANAQPRAQRIDCSRPSEVADHSSR